MTSVLHSHGNTEVRVVDFSNRICVSVAIEKITLISKNSGISQPTVETRFTYRVSVRFCPRVMLLNTRDVTAKETQSLVRGVSLRPISPILVPR